VRASTLKLTVKLLWFLSPASPEGHQNRTGSRKWLLKIYHVPFMGLQLLLFFHKKITITRHGHLAFRAGDRVYKYLLGWGLLLLYTFTFLCYKSKTYGSPTCLWLCVSAVALLKSHLRKSYGKALCLFYHPTKKQWKPSNDLPSALAFALSECSPVRYHEIVPPLLPLYYQKSGHTGIWKTRGALLKEQYQHLMLSAPPWSLRK